MNSSSSRLNARTFNPANSEIAPTAENIEYVTQLLTRVHLQLQTDRANLQDKKVQANNQETEEVRHARELRNESLQYYAALNDWKQAAVLSKSSGGKNMSRKLVELPEIVWNPCKVAMMEVTFPPSNETRTSECIYDERDRIPYVFVRTVRDTLYGEVKLYKVGRLDNGRVIATDTDVAVKSYDKDLVRNRKSKEGGHVNDDPIKELKVQKYLSNPPHPNVLPLISTMHTSVHFFAVFPYIQGGDLFEYIFRFAPLSEVNALKLMKGMVEGLFVCHQMGVVHSDVSLENYLITDSVDINRLIPILIDFGLCGLCSKIGERFDYNLRYNGPIGKRFYMAPEVHDTSTIVYDGAKADVWSLGVCLLFMLTKAPFWNVASPVDQNYRAIILNKQFRHVLRVRNIHVSDVMFDLLNNMLNPLPEARFDLLQVARHPVFRS